MDENPSLQTGHEQLVVDIKYETRTVLPAVKLERKQIKMTRPPDTVPCIVTVTEEEQTETKESIVGETDPLEEEDRRQEDVAASNGHAEARTEADKPGSRLTVPLSEQSARRSSAMEFFEEQEKSFQEQIKMLPKIKKQRSPSPSTLRQSVGLDHLDNLVRLMEQLSTLRDENSRLKNRCEYLESTKELLQLKSRLYTEVVPPSGYSSLPKPKSRLSKSHTDPETHRHEMRRSRTRTRQELQIEEFVESSSDKSPKRPKPKPLHKRSYSTGSIDVPSEIMEDEEIIIRKTGKSTKMRKEITKHKKSKSSKWARVKKVFYEDLGTSIKSIRDFGRASQVRYTTSDGRMRSELSPPTVRVHEGRSLDSGVSSSLEVDPHGMRTSTSSAEVSSPSRSPNQTDEGNLCTDVWMGPPEWQETHISERKESSCSGVSSDVSSVIEIKKFYLGKDTEGADKYLKVRPKLPRRRSSPSLITDTDDMEESLEVYEAKPLHRSSSYKSETDSIVTTDDVLTVRSLEREAKKQKTPWKRMKDIMLVRKDSKKKKSKSDFDGSRSEETSEIDMEALREEHLAGEVFGDGVMSQSTPKTSPMSIRPSQPSQSDVGSPSRSPFGGPPSPNVDLAALMATGVSDEFNRKMQEWEHKKSRKSIPSIRGLGGLDESDTFSQVSSRSSELDRSRGKDSIRKHSGDTTDDEQTSEEVSQPSDLTGASANVDDLQRRITESFSRKLQEWERIKYRRDTRDGSPEILRKGSSKSRKDDRQKSKKSREDREKEKMEKLREREIQKVEREQVKLEKEKLRLDKERLRALEREAKLEKMKGRLSQTDIDPPFKNPVLSPLAEYKVTADFAHKLHEWEMRKGLSHDISTAIYLEAQKCSVQQQAKEGLMEVPQIKHERSKSDSDVPKTEAAEVPTTTKSSSDKPPPLTLQPYWGTPEASPVEKTSDISYGDDTSVTEDSIITRSNIYSDLPFVSLERANTKLLEQLHEKESEYNKIQEEVKELNEKLDEARQRRQGEIAQLQQKSENGASLAAVSFEPMSVASTVVDLEEKITQLETLGETLADSMESAAIGKWNTLEGEGSVSTQLMEMVDKMKDMLSSASQTEEATQKSSALHDFEKLYSQAMKLQVQMNNLRLSHLERNKEIMEIKRQLLLQEVNNLLLQVDITRRESELYQYQEGSPVKRWSTFSEADSSSRVIEGQEGGQRPPLTKHSSAPLPDTESKDESTSTQHIPLATAGPSDSVEPASKKKASKKEKEKKVKEKKSKFFHSKSSKKDGEKRKDQSEKKKTSAEPSSSSSSKKKASSAMESSLELSCSLVLPTATVSLPRDITKTDTGVPKVEKGSPTLAKSQQEKADSQGTKKKVTYETPDKPIPESQQRSEKPKLTKAASVVDDEYSPPETLTERTAQHVDSTENQITPDSSQSESATVTRAEAGQATLIPSPVIRSKYPHSRGETRVIDTTDSGRRASPKPILKQSQPVYKPPLPKQSTPLTHSPVLIHSVKNGSRSKSVDEVRSRRSILSERETGHVSFTTQEKRATLCDTAQPFIELRKTPSPTLYLPRVGLVTPVRQLKPAAELLEESQRYRKGHSVYTQRILQRYMQKEELRLKQEMLQKHDKENISGVYAKSVLKKSREGTPVKSADSSTNNSSLSLQRTDSAHQAELVQPISHKLSSSSGSEKPKTSAPFKDLTNGGHLSEKYVIDSPERTLSDSELQTTLRTAVPAMKRRSCEVGVSYDPASTVQSFVIVSTTTGTVAASTLQPESTISPTNHSSMPTLSSARQESFDEQPSRDRSATYATSRRPGGKEDIESIGTTKDKPTTSQSGPIFTSSQPRSPILKRPSSPRSPSSRARRKMGTIGVLCKQSISFDLGVSLYTPHEEGAVGGRQRDSGSSMSPPPSSSRPTSTSSEGEVPSTSKDEKKKQRSKFLDAKWLQKPKKFFKVSK